MCLMTGGYRPPVLIEETTMEQFQWPSQGAARLICKSRWQETPDCISFTLTSEEQDKTFSFIAGQFVTLGVEIDGNTEYRAYSLSSLSNQTEMQFTVKRVAGGKVSNYLNDHLQVGQSLQVLPPAGQFHIEQPHTDKILLLSAGCGITPVMSMAKTLLADSQDCTEIHFIHAATCAEQLIYHAELQQMEQQHPRFKLDIMLEDATNTDYLEGRLTQAALANYCPDIASRTAFLCGPVGFMQAMKENLAALDMDMTLFYQESFTPAESTQPEVEDTKSKAAALAHATVFVPSFGTETKIVTGSLLIDALESAKVPVIAACRSGICGSCKCKVTNGDFTRTSSETLTEQEIAEGFVLACSCQIHSDVEVSLN